ncbi:GNAT family N-acetyltransferase [Aureimonas sp. AU4]|uniref:GNAT family N-acetyltransferase n=1 Tax=Aureimonas sp. AU4 TaxID=1638163 RepID=UPI000782EA9E|nr:GNAT family N-acetyltransferase [Aureimonas sp. AU4]
MTDPVQIHDLRALPAHADTVADRGWREWWRASGTPLATYRARVEDSLSAGDFPFTLVAHRGGAFVGMASLIRSDMEARPDLTPWVAAVFVEPAERGKGLGGMLVKAVAGRAFGQGRTRLFLCAEPRNAPFYARMGWRTVEANVNGLDVLALNRR